MKIKLVYICHPFSHGGLANSAFIETNKKAVERICKKIVKKTNGYVLPIAPQIYFQHLLTNDNGQHETYELAMQMCLALVRKCDEVWVYGIPVFGMIRELDLASSLKIPIINV